MELDKLKHNVSLIVFSAAAGAIALAVVGFNVGGWVYRRQSQRNGPDGNCRTADPDLRREFQ